MISSFQQNVLGSLASCAPMCDLGCHRPMTAPDRVGEDGHAADVHDVHGWRQDRPPVGADLGDGVVGVVHVDVGHPRRREVGVHLRTQASHRLAAETADRVAAGLGRALGAFPAEERAVELLRLGEVRAAHVHPGRDSVVIALELHGALPCSTASRPVRRYPIDRPPAPVGVRRSRECHTGPTPDEPQPDRVTGGAAGPGPGRADRALDRRRDRHRLHHRQGRRSTRVIEPGRHRRRSSTRSTSRRSSTGSTSRRSSSGSTSTPSSTRSTSTR